MNPTDTERSALPAHIEIVMAEVEDLDDVAPLFDQYRLFYGRPSDLPAARHFLFERTINHESVIYLARDRKNRQAAGFLQMYPGFSSLAMRPQWILNDLYVASDYQRQGIARALVLEAMDLVSRRQDLGLTLETAPDNAAAQQLYTALGFKPDNAFQHFSWQAD